MNEIDKFFDDLPSEDKKEADIFDDKPKPKEEDPAPIQAPEEGEPRKNRRHRRLEAQLQEEREARIRAEERAAALSESTKSSSSLSVDDKVLKIYGNETPEAREASRLLQEALTDYSAKAKKEAIEEMERRAYESVKEEKKYEEMIDKELESIEDQYDVDLTSDAPSARKMRREYLEMVQRLSPKDSDGSVSNFADFNEVWSAYQSTRGQGNSAESQRRKEIASKSMAKSGQAAPVEKQPTAGFRGWMKDMQG